VLILGGEACPHDLVRRWWTSTRRLVNTYGPMRPRWWRPSRIAIPKSRLQLAGHCLTTLRLFWMSNCGLFRQACQVNFVWGRGTGAWLSWPAGVNRRNSSSFDGVIGAGVILESNLCRGVYIGREIWRA